MTTDLFFWVLVSILNSAFKTTRWMNIQQSRDNESPCTVTEEPEMEGYKVIKVHPLSNLHFFLSWIFKDYPVFEYSIWIRIIMCLESTRLHDGQNSTCDGLCISLSLETQSCLYQLALNYILRKFTFQLIWKEKKNFDIFSKIFRPSCNSSIFKQNQSYQIKIYKFMGKLQPCTVSNL